MAYVPFVSETHSDDANIQFLQPGALTQDVYEFADAVNRTVIGGYHQTIGFGGGYFLVCTKPLGLVA